ncbi:MAG: hypothetical protein HZB09_00300 [Candidatus Yonathbacteria bacterium]|nr:hypothetical protein [Candidatus Yonathbacteria bacterium]
MLDDLIAKIGDNILTPLMWILTGAATIYFLWGVFEFIRDYDSPEARSTGAQHMLWGVIGMFIMISVFGIMNLIGDTILSI